MVRNDFQILELIFQNYKIPLLTQKTELLDKKLIEQYKEPLLYVRYKEVKNDLSHEEDIDRLIFSGKVGEKELEYLQVRDLWKVIDVLGSSNSDACQFIQKYRFMYDSFVPYDVQYDFERFVTHKIVYKWHYQGKELSLIFFQSDISLNPQFVNKIVKIVSILSQLPFVLCDTLSVKFFLSLSKKKTSRYPPYWTPFNINTACTYRGSCNSILIWRKEEVIKSIFHEFFHSQALEFEDSPEYVKRDILEHFSIDESSVIRLYEAYVEWWANMYNLKFISLEKNIPFDSLYEEERDHVLCQVAKILLCSGFSSWEDFRSNNHLKIVQSTDMFSYFIVRSAMYHNAWFVETLHTVEFIKNDISVKQFWETLLQTLLSDDFGKKITNRMRNKNIDESMRMTKKDY